MKEVIKRACLVVLIYLAGGFLVSLFISFKEDISSAVLPPFVAGFKMRGAVISFAQGFPALISAGLLAGYAIAFRKFDPDNTKRHRNVFDTVKSAFVFAIVLSCVYAILAECVIPILKGKQAEAEAKTAAYNTYMLLYSRESDNGNFRAAFANAEAAISIWMESAEAQEAADAAFIKGSELHGDAFWRDEEDENANGLPLFQSGYTALELLEMAQEAAAQADFYNAHYFAALSWRMAASAGDPNRDAALRLASESWNRITEALDELRAEPEREYYEQKIKGYSDIRAGDFLSAYYHLLDMKENVDAAGGDDPDIEVLLEIARQGVIGSFFFIDETESLALFEQEGGIFFTLPNDAGGKDAVLIGGVFRHSSSAEDGAYFRDFEIARFDGENKLVFQISSPYAKMLPFEDSTGGAKPQLVLTAVDRTSGGERIEPRVVAGTFPPQDAVSPSVLLLDMPYRDMTLILDSSEGVESMSIPELFEFARRAERYGFEGAACLAEFIRRLSDPFIVLILAVVAIVWAWKFQLRKSRPVSAWWVIPMPLVAVVCGYAVAAARHAASLFFTLLAAKTPSLAIPISAGVVVVLFFAASAWLFSQGKGSLE